MSRFANRKQDAKTAKADPAAARLGFWRRQWRDNVKPILLAVGVALLIRQFLIQAFRIPTGSMKDTLLVGDFLFVNKFLYGAKTPDRIRIPLIDWTIVDNLPVLQFPGIREPRQGDIIVFEYPLDRHQDYIKRCVAVAGDRVQMRDGLLLVNDRVYEDDLDDPEGDTSLRDDDAREKPHSRHDVAKRRIGLNARYGLYESLGVREVTARGFLLAVETALDADVGLDASILAADLAAVRGHVTGEQALSRRDLRRHLDGVRRHVLEVAPPFVVPEGHIFMVGDNRYNSQDSRFWGPLDTDLLKGKAEFIYWSWDGERTLPRLNRLGDLIR